MKRINLFNVAVLSLLFSSCSNDEQANSSNKEKDSLSKQTVESIVPASIPADKPEGINAQEIETIINDILRLARGKDVTAINEKYVHSDIGVYDVIKQGLYATLTRHDKFEIPAGSSISAFTFLSKINTKLMPQQINVSFECDGEGTWSQKGLFYTKDKSVGTESFLTEAYNNSNERGEVTLNAEQMGSLKNIENNSIRVIDTNNGLLFYLTSIDGKYYLTAVDIASADCSA